MSASAPRESLTDEHDDCRCRPLDRILTWGPLQGEPLLSGIDSRARLVAALLFALVTVNLHHLPTLLAAVALAGAAALAARLPPLPTLRRVAALDGFMALVLTMLPFTVPGTPLLEAGGLAASREGMLQAAEIVLKSNAVLLMLLALVGSMEPVEMGHAMARLRLPGKLVHLFLFTIRYIEVLGREYQRLRTAMKARGFSMRCDMHTWRSVGYLFGMLMVQSIERSERILAAMRCRGFQGRFHPLAETRAFTPRDRVFAAVTALTCLALVGLEHT